MSFDTEISLVQKDVPLISLDFISEFPQAKRKIMDKVLQRTRCLILAYEQRGLEFEITIGQKFEHDAGACQPYCGSG